MNSIEPGWYVDYQNPKQMRFHDGQQWTEHVHPDRKNLPPQPVAARAVPPMPGGDPAPSSRSSDLLGIGVVALFCGLMFGGFLFNGIGSISPLTDHQGTVDRIEIDYSRTSNSLDRATYVLSGRTAEGEAWRIVDEDAYWVLDREGYPQAVTVSIGAWSDSAERVVGQSFVVDHQSTGERIGWGVALGLMAVAALGGAVLIARSRSGGLAGALVFLVVFAGPGSWLGFQAFQWVQSP